MTKMNLNLSFIGTQRKQFQQCGLACEASCPFGAYILSTVLVYNFNLRRFPIT